MKSSTLDNLTKARDLCRRAVALDPNNATALQCAAGLDYWITYAYHPDECGFR